MLVFHETVLTALIIESFKYQLLNCVKTNVPRICKRTVFIKKKNVLSRLHLGIYTAFMYLQFGYRHGNTVKAPVKVCKDMANRASGA